MSDTSNLTARDPKDLVPEVFHKCLEDAATANLDELSKAIGDDLNGFLESLIPGAATPPPEDSCDGPQVDPVIRPFCGQLRLAFGTCEHGFRRSTETAGGVLEGARNDWNPAVGSYAFNATNADVTLRAAVQVALAAYRQKNTDSGSRNMFLYFTVKNAVASAIQAFEANMASAASTLAGAAGTLLAQYIDYMTAIQAAQATRQVSDAAAQMTFWQSVEQTRDSN